MRRAVLISLAAGMGTIFVASADVGDYRIIIDRNSFRLTSPVASPQTPTPNEPPLPATEVTLTGITTLGDEPKLLVEITDASTRKTERPAPLRIHDKFGSLEVIAIDANARSATVRIHGVEMILTFEKNGRKPSAVAGATASAGLGTIPGSSTTSHSRVLLAGANPSGVSGVTNVPKLSCEELVTRSEKQRKALAELEQSGELPVPVSRILPPTSFTPPARNN